MDLLAVLKSTAVFASLAAAALGLGAPSARWLRLRSSDRLECVVWEAALGLLAASTLLGWLGHFGLLSSAAIVAATVPAALYGVRRLRQLVAMPPGPEDAAVSSNDPPQWIAYGLAVAAAAACLATFVSALVPPTAGDALTYHLELPKRFLQAGELTFTPDDDNNVYPLAAEMSFLWALAFGDAAATALVHWGYGLLAAGAAYVTARPVVGSGWARATACLALLTPGLNNQMTAPLNDAAVAPYLTLAVAAWMQARRTNDARRFVLVGLMLGGTVGVKYTGLIFALSLAVVWLATAAADVGRRRDLLIGAAWAMAAAFVVAGLWYGRAAWYRGDPVYPFLSRQAAIERGAFPESKAPLGRGPAALAAAPWMLTMEPARFGGRAHQLGPLFLMFVPCLLAVRKPTGFATPLTVAALYAAGCLLLRQNVRFLLPIVPILSTSVVLVWREMPTWPCGPRRVAAVAAVGVVLLLAVVPQARLRHTAAAVLGRESFAGYLSRTEPTYEVAAWINTHLPAESRILSQEQRAFYLQPAVTRESLYRRRTQYAASLASPADLNARLRSDGFTHLLTAEMDAGSAGSPGDRYDATLVQLAEAAADADPAQAPTVVRQWRHIDAAGTARRYRLWELR